MSRVFWILLVCFGVLVGWMGGVDQRLEHHQIRLVEQKVPKQFRCTLWNPRHTECWVLIKLNRKNIIGE